MTNTNLMLFICDLLSAAGSFIVLIGLLLVLFSTSLEKDEGKSENKNYIVKASKHFRTGLILAILGFLLLSMSASFELLIY